MKAEFELSIDQSGNPCIKFRHHDKDNSLDQKILGVLVKAFKQSGCSMVHTAGYLESGTKNSWEEYEIQIKTHD